VTWPTGKRRISFSTKFLQDLISASKAVDWDTTHDRRIITITIDYPRGHQEKVPIKITHDQTNGNYAIEWEVPEFEAMFERDVFRDLKG
jgi:hypothetical protein